LHERRVRRLSRGFPQHSLALVEPRHVARQVLGQVAGAARDVERAPGRQGRKRLDERRPLDVPVRTDALGERPAPEVPVVVLGRTAVVVLLHGS
jgi:hypothetical protein